MPTGQLFDQRRQNEYQTLCLHYRIDWPEGPNGRYKGQYQKKKDRKISLKFHVHTDPKKKKKIPYPLIEKKMLDIYQF